MVLVWEFQKASQPYLFFHRLVDVHKDIPGVWLTVSYLEEDVSEKSGSNASRAQKRRQNLENLGHFESGTNLNLGVTMLQKTVG